MNRRAAIRKAFGFGAAAAALPLLDKVATAQVSGYGDIPTCVAPAWTPPPPDTRTPEQVLADQDRELVEDSMLHLTRERESWNRRYAYTLQPQQFGALESLLQEKHVTVEARTIGGLKCLIGPNGNIVREAFQQLYI